MRTFTNTTLAILAFGTLAFSTLPGANAAEGLNLNQRFEYAPGTARFEAQEWQLDIFGAWASRDRDDFDDNTGAFGAGVNYFFNRYLGAGAETYLDEVDWPNHLDLSLIGRYPLEDIPDLKKVHLAPYAFGGFGRQFHDAPQWTGHLGLGIEYRLNPLTGIFTDLRRIFPANDHDLTLWRFGLRFKF